MGRRRRKPGVQQVKFLAMVYATPAPETRPPCLRLSATVIHRRGCFLFACRAPRRQVRKGRRASPRRCPARTLPHAQDRRAPGEQRNVAQAERRKNRTEKCRHAVRRATVKPRREFRTARDTEERRERAGRSMSPHAHGNARSVLFQNHAPTPAPFSTSPWPPKETAYSGDGKGRRGGSVHAPGRPNAAGGEE